MSMGKMWMSKAVFAVSSPILVKVSLLGVVICLLNRLQPHSAPFNIHKGQLFKNESKFPASPDVTPPPHTCISHRQCSLWRDIGAKIWALNSPASSILGISAEDSLSNDSTWWILDL